jgi:short-subunit dehydrogenase
MRCNYYTLITGASQGLGKYLALEGAQRGWNLVLIALPGSGLPELAGYIERHWAIRVVVVEKDLCLENACTEIYFCLKKQGILINRLINNAGMGGNYAFEEKGVEFFSRQINLNATVPTVLTRLFLDYLRQAAPSFILNVSSLACFFDLPSKQVYGGTKSYLLHFSRSLRKEVREDGISVSVVCPGGMDTRWQLMMENRLEKRWISRQSVMHPAMVARIALDGLERGKGLIIPGAWNKCFLLMNRIFPQWFKTYLTRHRTPKLKPVLTQPAEDVTVVKEAIAV